MPSNTVYVKNISPQTSEEEIKEFFSFCGKITSLDVKEVGETKEATVTFEKATAAKTALLLDHTQLGSTQVSVSSDDTSEEGENYTHNAERDTDEITQEEKPRSRIIAEYLAHGYVIRDVAVQRAIDLDQKHGVSSRFMQTLQKLDTKYKATDKAKGLDQTYAVTPKVNSLLTGLNSYYEKASNTPTGKKLVNFYTQTSRQVQDIHAEARRLADIKKKEAGGAEEAVGTHAAETEKTTCKCGANSTSCSCEPGTCACVNCAKSDARNVQGTDKTSCNCGGNIGNCPCEEGHCACSSCPKADLKNVGDGKTKCSCRGDDNNCACTPGQCTCNDCSK
jgi:hypothetical protein